MYPNKDRRARLHFDRSVYFLIRYCFVNELWECESKLNQYILDADFELDQFAYCIG